MGTPEVRSAESRQAAVLRQARGAAQRTVAAVSLPDPRGPPADGYSFQSGNPSTQRTKLSQADV